MTQSMLASTISSSIPVTELQSLFGAVPDAVLTADALGYVEFLNPAAEQLTHQLADEAVGRHLREVLPLASERGSTLLECPAQTCRRTGVPVGPLIARLAAADDIPLVLEVSAAPMMEAGIFTGVILFARDVTRARQISRRLSYQATHDALTGLVNRSEFERRLGRALVSAARDGAHHVIGFLDLDGFKRINDLCGHLAGDQLLRELSSRIGGMMRARDTIARLGGDEFGILLEHCSSGKAIRIAQQIRKAVSEYQLVWLGQVHHVGASIGIVPLEKTDASMAQVLNAADAACYRAKRAGGNRIQVAGACAEP